MRRNRIIAGAAAIMVMACSAMPSFTFAAGEKVAISANKVTAEAGGTFEIEVSLSDIPSTGINACEFAIGYDSTLVTISDVEAGPLTETKAESVDTSASSAPLFDYYIDKTNSAVNVCWSTAAEDSKYWLQGEGVMLTITGTVSSSAKSGSVADFDIQGIARETYPGSGVTNKDVKVGYYNGTRVMYDTALTNGSVTVGGSAGTVTLAGDANCDGKVDISDAVLIKCFLINEKTYSLTAQGKLNADVQGNGNGVNAQDAVSVQKYILKAITSLPV